MMSSTPRSRDSANSIPQPTSAAEWEELLLGRIRQANSVDDRMTALELCRTAVEHEPGSALLWKLYADWVWLLYKTPRKVDNVYQACSLEQEGVDQEWDEEDKLIGKEVFQWGRVIDVWQEAAAAMQWHIDSSNLLWDPYLELLEFDLSQNKTPEKVSAMMNIYLERLQRPHATWEDTFQAFSHFVTAQNEQNYEQVMVDTRKRTSKARDMYSNREMKEQALLKASQHGDDVAEIQAFRDYLGWEEAQLHRKKGAIAGARHLLKAICERATTRFPHQADLWADFIVALMENPIQDQDLQLVAKRATEHCPGSGELWQLRMYAAEACQKGFDEVHNVKHAATGPGKLQESGRMDEQIKVDYAWCSYLRRKAFKDGASEDDRDVAEVAIRSCIDEMMADGQKLYGKNFMGDPEFRLERVYLKFLAQAGRLDDGRKLFERLEKLYGDGIYFWERWYLWEMTSYGSPFDLEIQRNFEPLYRPSYATAALERALNRPNLDWPEKLIEMYMHHCGQHEDISKILEAIVSTRRLTKRVEKLREKQRAGVVAQNQYYSEMDQNMQNSEPAETASLTDQMGDGSSSKRKREDANGDTSASKRPRSDSEVKPETNTPPFNDPSSGQTAQIKRDRENTTIIVKHLPSSADESAVRSFFRNCGDIKSLKLIQDPHTSEEATATIEFAATEDVLTAQTRDKKTFQGSEIDVQVGTGTTLFVTNYPGTADEQYMRDLFSPYGQVVEVRFPSLKYNTHRRFCYVQFITATQARAATALEGKAMPGGTKLQARISNPKIKQPKSGPSHEGREVYVGNVNWNANEAAVEDLFRPFGTVESVRMPRNLDGKHRAVAFVVFATKEQAEQALVMNLKEFKGRVLKVQPSDPRAAASKRQTITFGRAASSASPAPSADIAMSGTADAASAAASNGDQIRSVHHRERTLALLELPDTVSSERVQALCSKFGPLKKIQLRADHAGAIVEFEDVHDMGKASMALDGQEIDGAQVRVGTVQELLYSKAAQKSQPQSATSTLGPAPPQAIRPTPNTGQGSRRGGRGGLGFRGGSTMRAAAEASVHDGVEQASSASKGKSQADFRALLLGGKKRADEQGEDHAHE